MKKTLAYLLTLLIAVQTVTSFAFAEAENETEEIPYNATQEQESLEEAFVIPDEHHIRVNDEKVTFTVDGNQTVILRLEVSSQERIHVLASGVDVTLVVYDEAEKEVRGVYDSASGLLDVPLDVTARTYLLGFSGYGEIAVRVADEETTAQIYAGDAETWEGESSQEQEQAEETEAEETEVSETSIENHSEELSDTSSFGVEENESPAEPADEATPAAEQLSVDTLETATDPPKATPEEDLPLMGNGDREVVDEAISAAAEQGSPETPTETVPETLSEEPSDTSSFGVEENDGPTVQPDEVTSAAAEQTLTETQTETPSENPSETQTEPPAGDLAEEPEENKNFFAGFVGWLVSNPSDSTEEPSEEPSPDEEGGIPSEQTDEATPAAAKQVQSETQTEIPLENSIETPTETPSETPIEPPSEAPSEIVSDPSAENVTDDLPSQAAEDGIVINGEGNDNPAELTDEENPAAALTDLIDTPEEEEDYQMPFDTSVPIPYNAAMNETVSLLSILTEAGAPVNVITEFAGETDGFLVKVNQNGDWLLTPYAYFDSIVLTVRAGDYLAKDFSGSEALYTVILSNPNPAQETETGDNTETNMEDLSLSEENSNPAELTEEEISAENSDETPEELSTDSISEIPAGEDTGDTTEAADEEEDAEETDRQKTDPDKNPNSPDNTAEKEPERTDPEPPADLFDPSVPIPYTAVMNETVSLLSVLTEAGAPVNVITELAGETDGFLVRVNQNGDCLLTPYVYFDSIEISVTATDYLAEDPQSEAAVYTVILSNPDPDTKPAEEDAESADSEEDPALSGKENDALPVKKEVSIAMERLEDNRIRLFMEDIGEDNENLVYQWQFSLDNELWLDAPGANGREYTFRLDDTNSNSYWRLLVTVKEAPDSADETPPPDHEE